MVLIFAGVALVRAVGSLQSLMFVISLVFSSTKKENFGVDFVIENLLFLLQLGESLPLYFRRLKGDSWSPPVRASGIDCDRI